MGGVILDKSGTGYLRDGEGRIVALPESELADALDSGMEPATRDEAEAFAEHKQAFDRPFDAFVGSAIESATFGALSHLQPKGRMRELRAMNPTASAMGDVVGLGGSALVPGAPAFQAGRVGARAGSAVAERIAARVASNAASDASRIVTRGLVEGGLFGGGVSARDILREPGAVSADDAARRIVRGAVEGAALGGVIDLGLFGLSRTAKIVNAKLEPKKVELTERFIPGISGGRMVKEKKVRQAGFNLEPEGGYRVERSDLTWTGRAKRWVDKDEVLDEIDEMALARRQKSLQTELNVLERTGKATSTRAIAIKQELGHMSGWEMRGPVSALLKRVVAWKASYAIGAAATGAGLGIGAGLTAYLARPFIGKALSGFGHRVTAAAEAGKAAGRAVDRVAKPLYGTPRRAVQQLYLGPDEYEQVQEEVHGVDEYAVRSVFMQILPSALSPPAREALDEHTDAIRLLKETFPPKLHQEIPTSDVSRVSYEERIRASKVLAAVVNADSLIDSLAKLAPQPEQVRVWERIHPRELAVLRAALQQMVDERKTQGRVFTRREERALRIMRGEQMFDPRLVQMSQGIYSGQQERGPGRPRRMQTELAAATRTPLQKLGERA